MQSRQVGSEVSWSQEAHIAKRAILAARQRIKSAFRSWFEAKGFIEAECPIIVPSPGNETHLHAFETSWEHPDGTPRRRFIHTSPEFAMKKLLSSGETLLFDFARVARNREEGPLHAAEFTMLEWYRAHAPYEQLMDDCAALLSLAADITGIDTFRYREMTCDPRGTPQRLTVADAFQSFAGIDLLGTITPSGTGQRDDLAEAARLAGVKCAHDDSWSDIYSRVLVEKIEPLLGQGVPTILCEYPMIEAALARPKPGDPRVAERFEFYACGVELANAFGELTDATEQRRRFEADMALKEQVYGVRYPLDEELLAALPHMPPTSGIALGFDRLVLLATGARTIKDVMWA